MNNKRSTATETYGNYCETADITYIMKGVIDADTLEHISDECVGWSYGKLTISEILNCACGLKAVYVEDERVPTQQSAITDATIINHEYGNTGGGCMVSVFTLYSLAQNRTLYVLVSDDAIVLSTVDYVWNDVAFDDCMILVHNDVLSLDTSSMCYDLFTTCLSKHNERNNRMLAVLEDKHGDEEPDNTDEQADKWKAVREYVDTNVQEERQSYVMDILYDDDDFCNDLFKCETAAEIEGLLDSKLF